MRKLPFPWLLPFVFTLFAGSGCSISYSIDQSSDSLAQSSDSISNSSHSSSSGSSGDEVAAAFGHFLDDVSGLAAVWMTTPARTTTFASELGDLAMRYGIADWESEPRVFYAIGEGLRQAGADADGLASQPFLQSMIIKQNSGLIVSGYWGS